MNKHKKAILEDLLHHIDQFDKIEAILKEKGVKDTSFIHEAQQRGVELCELLNQDKENITVGELICNEAYHSFLHTVNLRSELEVQKAETDKLLEEERLRRMN